MIVDWMMCKRYGFPTRAKWYEQTPERKLENESAKILWDSPVKTDHKLIRNKPDILNVDKETNK